MNVRPDDMRPIWMLFRRMKRSGAFLVGGCLLLAGSLVPLEAASGEPGTTPAPPDQFRGEVQRLVRQLDSDRFHDRERAAHRLEQLVNRPELGPILAEEFQRVLVLPDTSFEVRKRLERFGRRLPEMVPEPAHEVAIEEIDRLIGQLEDDSYGMRLAATKRLEWLLGNPKLICPIMLRLKERMARNALSPDGL